jgi:small-conductance mechanosensitive channel
MFPILAALITLPFLEDLSHEVDEAIRYVLVILLILSISWLCINIVRVVANVIMRQNNVGEDKTSRRYRMVKTQLVIITRTIYTLIGILTIASILIMFPEAWQFGLSLLASAGVAGIIVGLSARPSIENMIASLQIAITQPFVLDDEVVIDGQRGFIGKYSILMIKKNRLYILHPSIN